MQASCAGLLVFLTNRPHYTRLTKTFVVFFYSKAFAKLSLSTDFYFFVNKPVDSEFHSDITLGPSFIKKERGSGGKHFLKFVYSKGAHNFNV